MQKQRVTIPQKPASEEPNEKFEAWKAQNEWYVKDGELQQEANTIGIGYGAAHPTATPEAVFAYVEKTIKKLYPEKFEGTRKVTEQKQAAVDSGGISRNTELSSREDKFSEADLTPDQTRIMQALVKRGVVTKAQYMAQMKDALSGTHKGFNEYNTKAK